MSFTEAGQKLIGKVAAGLYLGGTIVMWESQELVPVEYGTLKRSGRVEEPVIDGDTITVTVGYGYGTEYQDRVEEEDPDDSTGYAIYVHEIAEYKHAPPTTFKYLEKPARAFEPQLGPTIRAAVQEKS